MTRCLAASLVLNGLLTGVIVGYAVACGGVILPCP